MKQYKKGLGSLLLPPKDVIKVLFAAKRVLVHLLKVHNGRLPREDNTILVIQANVLQDVMAHSS